MQKPNDIVCEVCGKPLPREDFMKGKAVWLMGKNYCTPCKEAMDAPGRAATRGGSQSKTAGKGPASSKGVPAAKQAPRHGRGKVPRVTGGTGVSPVMSHGQDAHPTAEGAEEGEVARKLRARPSGAKNTVAVILVVVAVASVVVLLFFKGQEKNANKAAQKRQTDETQICAAAKEYIKTHPEDLSGALVALEQALNDLPRDSTFCEELKQQVVQIQKRLQEQNRARVWETPLTELKEALQKKENERNAIALAEKIAGNPEAPEKYRNEARQLVPQFWLLLAQKSVEAAKAAKAKTPPDLDAALDYFTEAQTQAKNCGETAKELLAEVEKEIEQLKKQMAASDIYTDGTVYDLLAADFLDRWVKEGGIKVERGEEWVLLKAARGASDEPSAITTPPDMSWRNFSLEISFRVVRKGFVFSGRCGREAQPFTVDFKGDVFTEGTDFDVVITMIGDRVKVEGENVVANEIALTAKHAQRGGISLRLLPSAEVRIYEMKIHALPR